MNTKYYEVWIDNKYFDDCQTAAEVAEVMNELNSMKGVKVVAKNMPLTLVQYDGDGNNRYNMAWG